VSIDPAQDRDTLKKLLKAAWAASAPCLVPFTLLLSFNQVDLLSWTALGRLGILSILVLLLCLAYLFWRGRFWAATPALLVFAGAIVYFAGAFIRVADMYLGVNPGEYMSLFMMLSPQLVIIVISITLGLVVWRGVRICWRLAPQPMSKRFWGIVILWVLVLGGDFWYQAAGWRYFDDPGDLMVRMCQQDQQLVKEARQRLYDLGASAVPDLLFGMAAPDPDLSCLRQSSRQAILDLGKQATEPLVKEAAEGNVQALRVLADLGDKRALTPLRELHAALKPDSPPEYKKALETALDKLGGSG
jgi:hypothetical protein